ncbi:RNA polymerase subunit sigma-24 [Verrucomicrobia bacterium SCGC AG-212-E04]|nr:RNA polymerase subunit sigma-24 [Verrucomicrobia bacterium SCGC AG-212-E04]
MTEEASFDWQACLTRVRQGGDEIAARELVRWLHPKVARIVRSHLPRRTSEEDLTQTVLIKVFQHLDQYQGKVPLEHWVARITVNTCLKQIRSEKARPEMRWSDLGEAERLALDSAAEPEPGPDPAEKLGATELVSRLMQGLNSSERLVITLLHLEGRSVREIQERTGWNVAVIKVRAFRARQKLRKLLRQLNLEENACNRTMISCLAC